MLPELRTLGKPQHGRRRTAAAHHKSSSCCSPVGPVLCHGVASLQGHLGRAAASSRLQRTRLPLHQAGEGTRRRGGGAGSGAVAVQMLAAAVGGDWEEEVDGPRVGEYHTVTARCANRLSLRLPLETVLKPQFSRSIIKLRI